MKAQSDSSPQAIERLHDKILINFNTTPRSMSDLNGTRDIFEYDQVEVSLTPTKAEIVDAIIHDTYPLSAEIALINNNNDGRADHIQEYLNYQNSRSAAKAFALIILSQI